MDERTGIPGNGREHSGKSASRSAISVQRSAFSVRRPGRGWVWYFVILACLVGLAIGIQRWWYTQRQRLTPDQLAHARDLWKANRPADYDLEYTKKGNATGTFLVQVRAGKVVAATLDGRPLEPRLYSAHDMPGLFDDIERFLEIDTQPGGSQSFVTATFDPQDGHLVRYVRSVRPRWRLQIDVRLRPPATDPAAASAPGHPGF
jgi:hypothetical protein